MKTLKDNLKVLRKNYNFTLKDISKKLNIALSTYNGYELGNNLPNIFLLQKIADIYQVSVDYLLGHETKNVLLLSVLSVEKREAIKKLIENNNLIASKVNIYIDVLKDRDAEIEKEKEKEMPNFKLTPYEINKLRELNEREMKNRGIKDDYNNF